MDRVLAFLIGLSIGSFLNVLIDRLPRGESVLLPRSHCDSCGKPLAWFELVPVVSYIVQAGRCRGCKQRLSLQYPLVELISGFGFLYVYVSFQSLALLISRFLLFSSLLVIFVSDMKYQIIPDSMALLGVLGAFLGFASVSSSASRASYLASAVGAALFFFLLHRLTGGRGMGLGDVKLSFLLGLIVGYPGIVFAVYLAFLTGALVGVILMLLGRKSLKSKIAFGPFLIVGTALSLMGSSQWVELWKRVL